MRVFDSFASDRSGKPAVRGLRGTTGAESDEGRPRKPLFRLAPERGLGAEGTVPPVWGFRHDSDEAAGTKKVKATKNSKEISAEI